MRLSFISMMLGVVALALAVTLAYQLIAPTPEHEALPTQRRDPVQRVSLPEPFTPPPLAQFAGIDARPVFIPERRPAKEVGVVVQAPPEPRAAPSLTLIGVILDGKHRIAIAKAGNRSVTLAPGTIIDGWSVVSIQADRVALKVDDEIHEIRLPRPVVRPPAASPAPAPPRPAPPRVPPPPGYAPWQGPPGSPPAQIPGRP